MIIASILPKNCVYLFDMMNSSCCSYGEYMYLHPLNLRCLMCYILFKISVFVFCSYYVIILHSNTGKTICGGLLHKKVEFFMNMINVSTLSSC